MRPCSRAGLVALCCCIVPAALAEEPTGRPMPNRFLFTSLGWLTSQAGQDYYPAEIPDQLVTDWRNYAAYMKEVGFTAIGPWGFLCNTFPYPLAVGTRSDIPEGQVRISEDKVRKARAIIGGCHDSDIRFYYGMCLYFAYWQDYVTACPGAAPTTPGILCPLYAGDADQGIPGTTDMMKQAIDFLAETLPLDGIALESFHHGRCKCPGCLERFPDTPRGTAEFHWFANGPVFMHIRAHHPRLKILFCAEGPLEVIQQSENLDILRKTLDAVDYFVWCSAIHPPETMRDIAAASPTCGLMLRQEPWQSVPPANSDRDGWFFPNLVNPLGRTIRQRADVLDWAGVAGCGLGRENPCDDLNLRFLARMQMNPRSNPETVVRKLLTERFTPRDDATLDELYKVFSEPELAFRKLWPTWFLHIDFMPEHYKFTALQTVEMINAYQLALARLRQILPDLKDQERARALESSLIKWIVFIQQRLREVYKYELPGTGSLTPASQAATAPVTPAVPQARMLDLPVRKRVSKADNSEQVVEETWHVPLDKVAFVTQHLWNNGEPDGPPQPEHLIIGSGTAANLQRTRDINARFILPALRAAREAGVAVVHSQPAFIANRYRQYQAIAAEVSGKPVEEPWAPAKIPAYTTEEMSAWTVQNWPGWGQMDFPTALRPLADEPVTVSSEELDHVLRTRGITTLVYAGYATDMCLINYTGGLNDMVHKFGYQACVLREATLATELDDGISAAEKTSKSLELIEREHACTASVGDFIAALRSVGPGHAPLAEGRAP